MQQQQELPLQPHMLLWPHLHPFCPPTLMLMNVPLCFLAGLGLQPGLWTAHRPEISVRAAPPSYCLLSTEAGLGSACRGPPAPSRDKCRISLAQCPPTRCLLCIYPLGGCLRTLLRSYSHLLKSRYCTDVAAAVSPSLPCSIKSAFDVARFPHEEHLRCTVSRFRKQESMPYLLRYRAAEDALRTPSAYFLIPVTSSRVMSYVTMYFLQESSWQESPSHAGYILDTSPPAWSDATSPSVDFTRLQVLYLLRVLWQAGRSRGRGGTMMERASHAAACEP